jgi:putative N6-adenine-specific DNA methylase
MSQEFTLIAKTASGLEDALKNELIALGAKEVKTITRAVSFTADLELMYKANLWLRTALKIIKPFHQFTSKNEFELYKKIKAYDWQQHLSIKQTFAIETVVNSPYFNHSQFVALKTKDAIVDQFREKNNGIRPSVDLQNPDVKIHLHIHNEQCSLALDSSGEVLYKRGWRVEQNEAPLNEVLAAGMVLLSGWDRQSPFYDFMCGSATLLIEAALISSNIAPGIFRKVYGFMKWRNFDKILWEKVYAEAIKSKTSSSSPIIGSDIDRRSIEMARKNIKQAGLSNLIKVEVNSFEKILPVGDNGTVIINPPYGERMRPMDILKLYQSVGDHLKKNFGGHQAWILSSNKDALKHIGLHPSKKNTLFNGALECKFQKYEMYAGSKKSQINIH